MEKGMSEKFNEVLDECVDRVVLRGETMESCLSRYPEFAAELEPQLRLVIRAADTLAFTPSTVAKERGRQRLQAELQTLRQMDEKTIKRRDWPRLSAIVWRTPRWAFAVASVVLAFLLAGAGTVSASSGAIPGDALYPVKRAAEETGLVLQFSQEGKAKLHLTYAERRAQEIRILAQQGATTHLEPALNALSKNLEAASKLAANIEDENKLAAFRSQLDVNGSQTLATLQGALKDASEVNRQAASRAFQESSWVYSNMVEEVAARAPQVYVGAGWGTLQIRAMDSPPPDVEKVLIEVSDIKVHMTDGSRGGWLSMAQEPQTFDLLQVAKVQKVLGELEVEPGTYTRLRMSVNRATVVAAGVEHEAEVSSGRLELKRPFLVQEGQTTVILLDFDGDRSLRITGRGEYIITPVVQILTQEPGIRERATPGAKERTPEAETTPSRIDLDGVVEAVTSESLRVRGIVIALTPDTKVDGRIEAGDRVEIEAIQKPGSTLVAVKVKAKEREREEKKGKDDKAKEKPAVTAVEVRGLIQSIDASWWIVEDREVHVTADTVVEGQAVVGASARIDGMLQEDGTILATRIVITQGEPEPKEKEDKEDTKGKGGRDEQKPEDQKPVRITGRAVLINSVQLTVDGQVIEITRDTVIDGTLVMGLRVEVEGIEQPDGRVVASLIKVLKPVQTPTPVPTTTPTPVPTPQDDSTPSTITVEGLLTRIEGARWQVGGHVVIITPQTSIVGIPVVGVLLEVEGVQRGDGAILAVTVSIE